MIGPQLIVWLGMNAGYPLDACYHGGMIDGALVALAGLLIRAKVFS